MESRNIHVQGSNDIAMRFFTGRSPAWLVLAAVSVVFSSSMFAAEPVNHWRRDVRVALSNPVQSLQELILVNDLDGNGTVEAVVRHVDLHRGQDAEFRIYEVTVRNGRGERGREIARVKTSDDYCQGIEFRDCDGDGKNELICMTIGRDGLRRGLHIVRIDRETQSFTILQPDQPLGQIEAVHSFQPKTASGPAELTVISVSSSDETVFSPVAASAGQMPKLWMRQVYQIEPNALRLTESVMHETPYYVLTKMIQALQRKDMFAAYKYMFADAAYHDFRKQTIQNFPYICAKQPASQFILAEWGLEIFRDSRTQGWLTFTHVFEENGRARRMMYQAFMRKVYDEWKITLLRKIQDL